MRNTIFYSICGLVTFSLMLGIMNTNVQKVIYFADPLNELVSCIFLLLLSCGFFIMAVPSKETV